MSFAAVVAGGVALAGIAVNADQSAKQLNAAKAMDVVNPGYTGNPALDRSAEVLRDRAFNFTMPGISKARQDIDRASESAFQAGVQGATSSNDVLDLASRLAYGSQSANNNLNAQQALSEQQALMDYLGAETRAGQNVADANAWDRQQYMTDRQERAELTNAGILNQNNAIQSGLSTVGQIAVAKIGNNSANKKLTPEQYAQLYYSNNG